MRQSEEPLKLLHMHIGYIHFLMSVHNASIKPKFKCCANYWQFSIAKAALNSSDFIILKRKTKQEAFSQWECGGVHLHV